KFRFYLSQQISSLNLKFALNSNWIVKTDLYDDLTKQLPDSDSKATSYATNSVENYMSYGPYKLTKYEFGKSFTMEKNDKWYGYKDGKHTGQYQMTAINTQIITDHNTVRQYFEQGKLDDFSMDKNDMATYGNSSRKTTTYESYTQKISFNSDYESLKGRQSAGQNKTILSNKNFREGLSLAMDRNAFAASTTAGSKGFTGLLNDLYLANVADGEMYRNTEQGKSVYQAVYGNLGGDPTTDGYVPSSLDEAEAGYNYAQAKYYVTKGIQEELNSDKDGHLLSNDEIDIDIRVYDNTSDTTIAMVSFLRSAFTSVISDANKALKTNITFNLSATKDEDYYSTSKTGGYDLIFSIWGGAAINPYGLMQVYCDSTFDSCCEYGFKGKQDKVTLDIDSDGDGEVETKSYNAWYTKMNNDLIEPEIAETVSKDSEEYKEWSKIHEQKLNILAGLEAGILNRFEAVPLVARGTSSLNSFKVENATKNYISLVGYGGIRFLQFKFNDAEWAKFISDPNYSADLYKN
ncbi:MAG: ABC transporter substrate-binding protein, partial [Bacteroidaceae bacterium]